MKKMSLILSGIFLTFFNFATFASDTSFVLRGRSKMAESALVPQTSEQLALQNLNVPNQRASIPSYNVTFYKILKTEGGCSELQREVSGFYLDPALFEEFFIYDYMLACIPYSSTESNVLVDLSLQAKDADSVSVLNKYIKAHQDYQIVGQTLHFYELATITTNRKTAIHLLPENSANPTWSYLAPQKIVDTYSSFSDYLDSVHRDAYAFFASPNMNEVLSFLEGIFGSFSGSDFVAYLNKGNYLTISTQRLMKAKDGTSYSGAYIDGAFRDCRRQDSSGFCKVK